jgi:hypothetical protein
VDGAGGLNVRGRGGILAGVARDLVVLVLVVGALGACGDDRPAAVDAALTDAAELDAPSIDAPVDAPPIDAAVIDARPIDATPDAAALDPHVDPGFGQGGAVRLDAPGGVGAITTGPAGELVLCGPSTDPSELMFSGPPWLGRIDAQGAGPAQVWTVAPVGTHEHCGDVVTLSDGRLALVTYGASGGRLQLRTAAGALVVERAIAPAHRLLRLAAAPDGGLWAVGLDGLSRYDAALAPVASFGQAGVVAFAGGYDVVAHGATVGTALVTVSVKAERRVRRFVGATGEVDHGFGVDGIATVPTPPGWPLTGTIRDLIALPSGGVAVMTTMPGPDPGTFYGMIALDAAGVAGPQVPGGAMAVGSGAVDPAGRVFWSSSYGMIPGLDPFLAFARTTVTTTEISTIVRPPPQCGTCRYATAGAVWAGGMVVAYTVRDLLMAPDHEFTPWLMRFRP